MRIIAGKYRGRVLKEFKGREIRPTADRAKEAIFNILQTEIYGSAFLDLFCGTGNMGIEALSRGAEFVLFNDKARASINLADKNLKRLKVNEGFRLSNLDAVTLLKNCAEKFNVVYIDPPYKSQLGLEALKEVERVLEEDGIVVFEDEKPFEDKIDGLIHYDSRKYGRVHLAFFKKGGNKE